MWDLTEEQEQAQYMWTDRIVVVSADKIVVLFAFWRIVVLSIMEGAGRTRHYLSSGKSVSSLSQFNACMNPLRKAAWQRHQTIGVLFAQ